VDERRVADQVDEAVAFHAYVLAPDGAAQPSRGSRPAQAAARRPYRALDAPTLVADDFFNAACVLGAPVVGWRALDLAALRGRMTINGAEVGTGRGGDILGHPLEALAWLANALASRGRYLKAGEFVLLGSVVETRWVEQGDLVEASIDGLGAAYAEFS
jgi:2-oxo-3-hexenedioate decarboxylase/2-keto-4-pentenoate hydratase